MANITVYGSERCEDTQRTRELLERLDVPYEYVDIDEDLLAADWVRDQNDGQQRTPTVDVGGTVLCVPSDQELERTLRAKDLVG